MLPLSQTQFAQPPPPARRPAGHAVLGVRARAVRREIGEVGDDDDRIFGGSGADDLDAGADDYVVTTFKPPELLARIRARLRTPGGAAGETLRIGDVDIDVSRHEVHRDGDPLALQTKKGGTAFSLASQPSAAWRVLPFGRTPGPLVDSPLVELPNPPPAEGRDVSWVTPGRWGLGWLLGLCTIGSSVPEAR